MVITNSFWISLNVWLNITTCGVDAVNWGKSSGDISRISWRNDACFSNDTCYSVTFFVGCTFAGLVKCTL